MYAMRLYKAHRIVTCFGARSGGIAPGVAGVPMRSIYVDGSARNDTHLARGEPSATIVSEARTARGINHSEVPPVLIVSVKLVGHIALIGDARRVRTCS